MSIRPDWSVEDAIILLKRNWFWSNEDLIDFLWDLSDDVFCEVWEHRFEFHPEIQYFMTEKLLHPAIKEYSDEQWNADQQAISEKRDKEVREFRKRFVAPPRPREKIDDCLDSLSLSILEMKNKLQDAIASASARRGYIPPNKRTAETYDTDPQVQNARKKLENLENEFERVKKLVDSLDKTWTEDNFIDAMIRNAGRLSEA